MKRICSTQTVLWIIMAIDILVTVVCVALGRRPSSLMGEGKPYTYLSFAQMVITALLAFGIYAQRRNQTRDFKICIFWLLVGIGFVFLSIDEVSQFHENLKKWILHGLGLPRNNITDRLDDLIVGIYVLTGFITLLINRAEVMYYKYAFRFFLVAFALGFLSVFCDTISHRPDVFHFLLVEKSLYLPAYEWTEAFDEIFKVLAEGMFLVGLYSCFEQNALTDYKTSSPEDGSGT